METLPVVRLVEWWKGLSTRPFDCEACYTHVASGERIDGFKACSSDCAREVWLNTTA